MSSSASFSKAPQPAYLAPSNSPIYRDPALLRRVAEATDSRNCTLSFTLSPRSGRAWVVPAGSVCRITTSQGPQVGDLNIWNVHNPRERFWAARTRQIHSSHVKVGDRLWSCLPFLRPLVTVIGDSIGARGSRDEGGGDGKTGYANGGVDEWGGRCHDLLGTRCDPYVNKLLTTTVNEAHEVVAEGQEYDFHCHSNLTRAVLPFGLTEYDVHDVLNVFQVTGLDKDGKYFMQTCPAEKGDYFELLAEVDVLLALSTCPGGDLSAWGWSEGQSMLDCCRPLAVEVFQITDESILQGWTPPTPSNYGGMHGIKVPVGEAEAHMQ